MVNLILDMLPDRVNSQGKQHIFTPHEVAEDMVHKIPNNAFVYGNTFLDPYCKSGIFLENIYQILMQSPDLIREKPDKLKRHKYILENQLFGISPTKECQAISIRTVYGDINVANNIIYLGDKYLDIVKNKDKQLLYEILEREFGRMKFNVVALNPPYNKGKDIDFINTAYELSTDYVIAITPAKWQTAKANQRVSSNMSYGEFREKIVPHMSYVCFFSDCRDIFNITEHDGITYFLLDKDIHTQCTVENKCDRVKQFNNKLVRDLKNQSSLCNIAYLIGKYIGLNGNNGFHIESLKKHGKYELWSGKYAEYGEVVPNESRTGTVKRNYFIDGTTPATQLCNIVENGRAPYTTYSKIMASDNRIEVESLKSYIDSKLVRFMIFFQVSAYNNILNDNTYRYVPIHASIKFDHIYTDEELYKTFNLPQEYIDVIEAVIKERK